MRTKKELLQRIGQLQTEIQTLSERQAILEENLADEKVLTIYWKNRAQEPRHYDGLIKENERLTRQINHWSEKTRKLIREELAKLQAITTWKGGPTNVHVRLYHPDIDF